MLSVPEQWAVRFGGAKELAQVVWEVLCNEAARAGFGLAEPEFDQSTLKPSCAIKTSCGKCLFEIYRKNGYTSIVVKNSSNLRFDLTMRASAVDICPPFGMSTRIPLQELRSEHSLLRQFVRSIVQRQEVLA